MIDKEYERWKRKMRKRVFNYYGRHYRNKKAPYPSFIRHHRSIRSSLTELLWLYQPEAFRVYNSTKISLRTIFNFNLSRDLINSHFLANSIFEGNEHTFFLCYGVQYAALRKRNENFRVFSNFSDIGYASRFIRSNLFVQLPDTGLYSLYNSRFKALCGGVSEDGVMELEPPALSSYRALYAWEYNFPRADEFIRSLTNRNNLIAVGNFGKIFDQRFFLNCTNYRALYWNEYRCGITELITFSRYFYKLWTNVPFAGPRVFALLFPHYLKNVTAIGVLRARQISTNFVKRLIAKIYLNFFGFAHSNIVLKVLLLVKRWFGVVKLRVKFYSTKWVLARKRAHPIDIESFSFLLIARLLWYRRATFKLSIWGRGLKFYYWTQKCLEFSNKAYDLARWTLAKNILMNLVDRVQLFQHKSFFSALIWMKTNLEHQIFGLYCSIGCYEETIYKDKRLITLPHRLERAVNSLLATRVMTLILVGYAGTYKPLNRAGPISHYVEYYWFLWAWFTRPVRNVLKIKVIFFKHVAALPVTDKVTFTTSLMNISFTIKQFTSEFWPLTNDLTNLFLFDGAVGILLTALQGVAAQGLVMNKAELLDGYSKYSKVFRIAGGALFESSKALSQPDSTAKKKLLRVFLTTWAGRSRLSTALRFANLNATSYCEENLAIAASYTPIIAESAAFTNFFLWEAGRDSVFTRFSYFNFLATSSLEYNMSGLSSQFSLHLMAGGALDRLLTVGGSLTYNAFFNYFFPDRSKTIMSLAYLGYLDENSVSCYRNWSSLNWLNVTDYSFFDAISTCFLSNNLALNEANFISDSGLQLTFPSISGMFIENNSIERTLNLFDTSFFDKSLVKFKAEFLVKHFGLVQFRSGNFVSAFKYVPNLRYKFLWSHIARISIPNSWGPIVYVERVGLAYFLKDDLLAF